MKRAFPWFLAIVALVAFGVSFSELQRRRGRFSEITRHQFHDHQEVRQFIIRAALADAKEPIIVIGDSITEMARLPETIDGKPVVNAGIGGATIEDFQGIAQQLLQDSSPSLVVVALGTNGSVEHYAALLSRLKRFSPRILAVGTPPQVGSDATNAQIKAAADNEGIPFIEQPLPVGSTLADHIHLNVAGYRKWVPALTAAISEQIKHPRTGYSW